MEFTIDSKKLGKKITFFTSGCYIWANTNGREGYLGRQLTNDKGSTLHVTEKNARKVAYRWMTKNAEWL